MIEAVTFDLGDTITDLREGLAEYNQRGLVRAGRVYDLLAGQGQALPGRTAFCSDMARLIEEYYAEALARQEGLAIHEALSRFCGGLGLVVPAGLLETCAAAWCQTRLAPATLRAGAVETLAALAARGLRLGVISNTIQPGRYLETHLAAAGVLDYFAARVYSSDAGIAKPHPGIFRMALEALGVEAACAVHVGDRLATDVAGAHAAGMAAILIEVPQRVEDDPCILPEARVKELPDLVAVLDSFR